ncbi:hypothetical protein ACC848_45395, partial [Rhizobium johnstonii]
SLNPITFTIGAVASAPTGSIGTVASAPAAKAATPIPATPPTAEGITIGDEQLAALGAGRSATVSAAGFRANETGIQ